jgi:hypothetical protein
MLKVTPRYLIRRINGRGEEECGTPRFLFKQNDLQEKDGTRLKIPFEGGNKWTKEDRNESYT